MAKRYPCNIEISVHIKDALDEAIRNVKQSKKDWRRSGSTSPGPNTLVNNPSQAGFAGAAVDFVCARHDLLAHVNTAATFPHCTGNKEQVTLSSTDVNFVRRLKPILDTRFDNGLQSNPGHLWKPAQECLRLYLLWHAKELGLQQLKVTNDLAGFDPMTPQSVQERVARQYGLADLQKGAFTDPMPKTDNSNTPSA